MRRTIAIAIIIIAIAMSMVACDPATFNAMDDAYDSEFDNASEHNPSGLAHEVACDSAFEAGTAYAAQKPAAEDRASASQIRSNLALKQCPMQYYPMIDIMDVISYQRGLLPDSTAALIAPATAAVIAPEHAAPAASGVNTEPWRNAAHAGHQAFLNGDYESAIVHTKEALRIGGEPSELDEKIIGMSYHALGQYKNAIAHYSNAIAISDSPHYQAGRSVAYLDSGQCDLAIADASQTLNPEPGYYDSISNKANASYVLATCYYRQGQYRQALQYANAHMAITSDLNPPHYQKEQQGVVWYREYVIWDHELQRSQVEQYRNAALYSLQPQP